jgi:hypothetical protein
MYVGGRFGPARVIALDAKGRTLAYGVGSGNVRQHAACPGGRRVVELVERRSELVAAVRELPTLRLMREQRLPEHDYGVASLRCIDAFGDKLALFSSNPDARGILEQITRQRVTRLWSGPAFYASFSGKIAIVQAFGRSGTKLVSVDLRTGRASVLGSVRATGLYELSPNAAASRLVGTSYEEGCRTAPCAHLVVVDLRPRPRARRIPLPTECCGSARWITGDRFAYAGDGAIRIYTKWLRLTGRIAGWSASEPVVLARTVYGVRHGGALVRVTLPSGPVRVVQRLPGTPELITASR